MHPLLTLRKMKYEFRSNPLNVGYISKINFPFQTMLGSVHNWLSFEDIPTVFVTKNLGMAFISLHPTVPRVSVPYYAIYSIDLPANWLTTIT